jgi:hypothetical protein
VIRPRQPRFEVMRSRSHAPRNTFSSSPVQLQDDCAARMMRRRAKQGYCEELHKS